MVALTTGALGLLDRQATRRADAARILADARALVLAHLATPDVVPGTRRLGQPGRLFDLPVAAGAGPDATEPDYDGNGETAGRCAFRGWTPGQALQPVTNAAARCFGRLAWRELGLVLPDSDPGDPAGAVPWVVVSPNLAADRGCLVDLNPLLLGTSFAAYGCDNRPLFPWLRVVDARGRTLSDRVAVALILPGPPLAGQVRSPAAGPAAWLDRFTLAPGCAAPCQPGTWSNAAFDHADGQPTTITAGPADDPSVARPGSGITLPLDFNDRLVWITADELFRELEKRARNELLRALATFRATNHYFPYAAPFDATGGDCRDGLRFGHPAVAAGNCGTGQHLALADWFVGGGWQHYFSYAVSDQCRHGRSACVAPGLTVGSDTAVNALIIAPGVPITTAPYAASLGAPQRPLNGMALSADARQYLDTTVNANGAAGVFAATDGAPAPANDRLEIVR